MQVFLSRDGPVLLLLALLAWSLSAPPSSAMPVSMSGSPPKPPSPVKEPVPVPGAPRWPGRDHDEFKRVWLSNARSL